MGGKIWAAGGHSFQGNLGIYIFVVGAWKEVSFYVHKNKEGIIVENLTPLAGNEHFFSTLAQRFA